MKHLTLLQAWTADGCQNTLNSYLRAKVVLNQSCLHGNHSSNLITEYIQGYSVQIDVILEFVVKLLINWKINCGKLSRTEIY